MVKKSPKYISLAKITVLIFICISIISLAGCKSKTKAYTIPEVTTEIRILTLNDVHGYLETSKTSSFSKIASYMDHYNSSIRISCGDMFQGTGISNLTKGRAVIDAMNETDFDCMVLGNHEFDWGIETILTYFDGDKSNGEAKFSLLAANVVDSDGNPLKYAKPYIIKEIQGARVGIIGVIGQDIESCITAKKLEGYEFLETKPIVEKYAKFLKNNLGCNMIILAIHDGSEENALYSELPIDLVLNAHTHKSEIIIDGDIPSIQTGYYSHAVGDIKVSINNSDVKILEMENVDVRDLSKKSEKIEKLVEEYKKSLTNVLNEEICLVENASKINLSYYATALMQKTFNVDYAFINKGCFRTVWNNGPVNYSDMLEMIPFDDEIKICDLKGTDIKKIMGIILKDHKDIYTNSNLKIDEGKYFIDDVEIIDSNTYKIAAIDYIFDKSNYPFKNGTHITYTTEYIRDLLFTDFASKDKIDFTPKDTF